MSGLLSQEIQHDFINELKSYIPTLVELTGRLESRTGGKKDLTEMHRLVHTVKGASSLIKLTSLTTVATELEQLLEDLLGGGLAPDEELFAAIRLSLAFFERYDPDDNGQATTETQRMTAALTALEGIRNKAGQDCGTLDELFSVTDQALVDPETAWLAEDDTPGCLADDDLCAGEDFDHLPDDDAEDDFDIELPQDELREGFYQEAEEHFQTLGEALSALETQITESTALIQAHKELIRLIRRAVHTIKGAAAVIKLTDIADWGHAYEDLLDWLYEEAESIDPEVIRILAEASDMLEQYVTAPDKVDAGQCDRLKATFARLIGGTDAEPAASVDHDNSSQGAVFVFDTPPEYEPVQPPAPLEETAPDARETPAYHIGAAKTLRVEMGKVEGLANLAGELMVAISAFDDHLSGLGGVIGELDHSRQRLKTTVRDLEVGYEVKAIQTLGTQLSQMPALTGPSDGLPGEFDDFDLLELDRYSEFNLLLRSLNETTVDVNTISTQLTDVHSGFGGYLNRLRILSSELQDKVMRIRMTPMTTIVHRLRQTVRQTAGTLHKNVRLVVSGEDIELDKQVWEKLIDPLMHILRNAVDHGIESQSRRAAVGKPDLATIRLSAAYQGNQVVIRVADDGAGLDFAAIRQRARTFTPDRPADEMDDSELAELIFLQGVSTRQQVSSISGRGVGLDVVRDNIGSLKGTVQIEQSEKGRGTTFVIRMPLTLAVMRSLLFEVNGRLYATSLFDIKEMLRIHPRDVSDKQGQKVITMGEHQIPLYYLSHALFPNTAVEPLKDASRRLLVLILDTGAWQGAVAIDRMHSQREIVIKNLGTHLREVKGISGATIMGDGKVVPILNIEELLRTAPLYHPEVWESSPADQQTELNVMVVDDSVSVRTVVSRLMTRQGWKVESANDGVDAIEKLRDYRPDIILLDVEMPRMNGYEFMSAIRAQDHLYRIPVIMLTSRSAKKHREKARSVGVNGYVVKPYDDEVLTGLIRKLTRTD